MVSPFKKGGFLCRWLRMRSKPLSGASLVTNAARDVLHWFSAIVKGCEWYHTGPRRRRSLAGVLANHRNFQIPSRNKRRKTRVNLCSFYCRAKKRNFSPACSKEYRPRSSLETHRCHVLNDRPRPKRGLNVSIYGCSGSFRIRDSRPALAPKAKSFSTRHYKDCPAGLPLEALDRNLRSRNANDIKGIGLPSAPRRGGRACLHNQR